MSVRGSVHGGRMKRCCTCHELLPIAYFHRRSASPDGRQNRCRQCFKIKYVENRDELYAKILVRHLLLRNQKEARLADYLVQHPCLDCGAKDLRVLDFDHRDPSHKHAGIGLMLSGGWTWASMLAEIEKCDVRCANCHRIRTSGQQNWWKQQRQIELLAQVAALSAGRLQSLFPDNVVEV